MKPALVIVLLLVIRPLFTVTPLFITGPLLVKVPIVTIEPSLTIFSVLVSIPPLHSKPRVFMVILPDEVKTPELRILPLFVIAPVGPLVIVPVELMLPGLLNGPLFVIVPKLPMKPLLVTVPEVVRTPPELMRSLPSFWMVPLLVIVPTLSPTYLWIVTVSAGPITRVLTRHVAFALVQTPPIGADSHDCLLDIVVEVAAIAFWAEKASTEIKTTSTGSTIAFFMYVIIGLIVCNGIKPRLHLS